MIIFLGHWPDYLFFVRKYNHTKKGLIGADKRIFQNIFQKYYDQRKSNYFPETNNTTVWFTKKYLI